MINNLHFSARAALLLLFVVLTMQVWAQETRNGVGHQWPLTPCSVLSQSSLSTLSVLSLSLGYEQGMKRR